MNPESVLSHSLVTPLRQWPRTGGSARFIPRNPRLRHSDKHTASLFQTTLRSFFPPRCPYIKVDFDFTLSDPKQNAVDERPTDPVSKISKPYLEWSIID